MISVRRDAERRQLQRGKHHVWLTFYPRQNQSSLSNDFGLLTTLDEVQIAPGGVFAARPPDQAKIVTYVHRGALAQEDSNGTSGVVHAGEFQHMTTGRGIRHKETNASRTEITHLFRLSVVPTEVGLGCAREQKRFATAQRRNVLCIIASPDGRKGSLPILQDAIVHSSVLDPGHHLIHPLSPNRGAWIHVICGEVTLHDTVLTQGDGVGVTLEPSVSVTAQDNAEILLVDLGSASGIPP